MAIGLELLLILLLVLLNGAFAMSELAIVSSRRGRLQAMQRRGSAGAAAALALAEDPQRFLPTVQVGITLVGILAGAFGGARLSRACSANGSRRYPGPGALLHPDRLRAGGDADHLLSPDPGRAGAEAARAAPPGGGGGRRLAPAGLLARVTAPVVWLLSQSSALVLRLFGRARPVRPSR